MLILRDSVASRGVISPAVWLRLSWMAVSSELANSPCSRLQKQKSSAPLRGHRCGQVTWQVLPLLWSSHLAGTGHMGSRSGEAVPVIGLPALYLSVDAPLLVQSSSATLPNLSRPQLWSGHLAGSHRAGRVAWQGLMRGNAFGPPLWSSCQAGTQKGGGFSSAALGHRPQNRAKGADPRTGNLKGEECFCPGVLSSSLSWPASAGAFLVPGRWFSGPAPSGSCLFWFRLMFLSIGRGRHVPAPGGRDVGSSAGAPTQELVQGTDPRTGLSRYPFTCVVLVFVLSLPLCVVYFILLLAALAFSSL